MKKHREIAMYIIGALIIAGFFILLYAMIYKGVPIENKELLNIVVGALIGSFNLVVGYFFGSSMGSKDKTELLNNKQP